MPLQYLYQPWALKASGVNFHLDQPQPSQLPCCPLRAPSWRSEQKEWTFVDPGCEPLSSSQPFLAQIHPSPILPHLRPSPLIQNNPKTQNTSPSPFLHPCCPVLAVLGGILSAIFEVFADLAQFGRYRTNGIFSVLFSARAPLSSSSSPAPPPARILLF